MANARGREKCICGRTVSIQVNWTLVKHKGLTGATCPGSLK